MILATLTEKSSFVDDTVSASGTERQMSGRSFHLISWRLLLDAPDPTSSTLFALKSFTIIVYVIVINLELDY